ncbi:hypothetical protein CRUP_015682 [Coryphaenoides rupestris]|nr:hypothetical protein CRUP_015682 [Coryphaenoides rupestris]
MERIEAVHERERGMAIASTLADTTQQRAMELKERGLGLKHRSKHYTVHHQGTIPVLSLLTCVRPPSCISVTERLVFGSSTKRASSSSS